MSARWLRIHNFIDLGVINSQKLVGGSHVTVVMFTLGAFLVEKLIIRIIFRLSLDMIVNSVLRKADAPFFVFGLDFDILVPKSLFSLS